MTDLGNRVLARGPLFLYDGSCPFCRLWAGRWKRRVGVAVEFRPFSAEAGRTSSEFVDAAGRTYRGAEGVFRMLASATPGRLLWCYERIPFFGAISEAVYRALSSCRACAYALTKWMFCE